MLAKLRGSADCLYRLEGLLRSGVSFQKSIYLLIQSGGHKESNKQALLYALKNGQPTMVIISKLIESPVPLPFSEIPQLPNLSEFIKMLADWYLKTYYGVRELKKKLGYPMFLLGIMIIFFGVVISMLVPIYRQFFEDLNQPVPSGLIFLNDIRDFLLAYGFWCCFVTFIGGVALYYGFREKIKRWGIQYFFLWDEYTILKGLIVLIEQGVSLKRAVLSVETESKSYRKFKLFFFKTGSFSLAWAQAMPTKAFYHTWMTEAEKLPNFTSLMHQLIQFREAEILEKREHLLSMIPYILMGLIGMSLFYFISIIYAPIIGIVDLMT